MPSKLSLPVRDNDHANLKSKDQKKSHNRQCQVWTAFGVPFFCSNSTNSHAPQIYCLIMALHAPIQAVSRTASHFQALLWQIMRSDLRVSSMDANSASSQIGRQALMCYEVGQQQICQCMTLDWATQHHAKAFMMVGYHLAVHLCSHSISPSSQKAAQWRAQHKFNAQKSQKAAQGVAHHTFSAGPVSMPTFHLSRTWSWL